MAAGRGSEVVGNAADKMDSLGFTHAVFEEAC